MDDTSSKEAPDCSTTWPEEDADQKKTLMKVKQGTKFEGWHENGRSWRDDRLGST